MVLLPHEFNRVKDAREDERLMNEKPTPGPSEHGLASMPISPEVFPCRALLLQPSSASSGATIALLAVARKPGVSFRVAGLVEHGVAAQGESSERGMTRQHGITIARYLSRDCQPQRGRPIAS
jgi:hypothetical protein